MSRKISFEESQSMWLEDVISRIYLNKYTSLPHPVFTYEEFIKDDKLFDGTVILRRHYSLKNDMVFWFVNSDIESFDDFFNRV